MVTLKHHYLPPKLPPKYFNQIGNDFIMETNDKGNLKKYGFSTTGTGNLKNMDFQLLVH